MNKFLNYLSMLMLTILLACSKDTFKPKITNQVLYKGVNLSVAEFGTAIPGVKGTDYTWPTNAEVDYFLSKGMNTIRLPFSWERLQPVAKGNFDANYSSDLDNTIFYATSRGVNVIIDPHNYARYRGNLIGSTQVPNDVFSNLWSRLALKYSGNQKVIFGLMNEPHDMPTEQWLSAANAATVAIRATGATNLISVPGNSWSNAASWSSNWYGTPNSVVMLQYKDTGNNHVFEVHNYLDANSSGTGTECATGTIGSERMSNVVAWAKANNKKLMIAEFAAPNTATCKLAVTDFLTYAKANSDVIVGWQWWAAGPWWGNNQLTIEPSNGVDRPQMTWLIPFIKDTVIVDAGAPDSSVSATKPVAPIAFTKNTVFTLPVNNVTNWVYVPTGYDSTHNTPISLFVWLHGCGGQGLYDVSMVSPGGQQSWISLAIGGREGACWSGVTTDGAKVLDAIADIKKHFNVDPRRVFLGGYSSGGDIGYPLAFANANLFAGVLFENTGPSSAAMLASTKATWKLNIAHLSHTGDTTYPIATIRTNMNTLKASGFPVVLIEKAGTHWDNDGTAYGTAYDLRTFLLPYLNAGWLAPGPVVQDAGAPLPICTYTYTNWSACQSNNTQNREVFTISPIPCAEAPKVLTQSCVYVDMTLDTDSDGIPDVNDKCPTVKGTKTSDTATNGCAQFVVTAVKTYDWGTGFCKQFSFKNVNPMPMSWKSMIVYMNDGKLRGASAVWGGVFSNVSGTGKITITPSGNATIPANTTMQTAGFCADYGPTKYVGTNGGLTF